MDKRMDVHGGHRERLRQRLMAEGADNFEPHELLEFLLYYAIPRQNVNMLAHELLNYFGNLRNVLNADTEELTRVKGMGEHAAQWLNLLGKCTDLCRQIDPMGFLNLSAAYLLIQDALKIDPAPDAPCLIQLCLNRRFKLLYRRVLSTSREWGEPETLKEGIRDVFSTSARYVALVLFTSDENFAPSEYDLQRINDYAHALHTADSVLLDMILIRGRAFLSLNREGYIPELQSDSKNKKLREAYLSDFPSDSEFFTSDNNHPLEDRHEPTELI